MRHFRQRLKNGARCRGEIVRDRYLLLEFKNLISANQNDETKRQIHIADDFAATACIIFESLTKMMHLSFSTFSLCVFVPLWWKFNTVITYQLGESCSGGGARGTSLV
jgi:hypothetical protein